MQALRNGELSAEVPHRSERTEIGSMADALQTCSDSTRLKVEVAQFLESVRAA